MNYIATTAVHTTEHQPERIPVKRFLLLLFLLLIPAGLFPQQATSSVGSSPPGVKSIQSSSIEGVVFYDSSGNGLRNLPSDTGLVGLQVILSGAASETTYSNADGNYSFSGLAPGTYTVSLVVPTGWVQTKPTNPGTYTCTITGDTTITGKDFGLWPQGIIQGTVFEDMNGNDTLDAGEPLLTGWIVSIAGLINRVDTTDANGRYEFVGLIPGTYTVTESLANHPGWGSIPELGYYTVQTVVGSRITLNFANYRWATISGRKYKDFTADSAITDDPTLSSWTVKLYRRSDQFSRRTTTSPSGVFTFDHLRPGTYSIEESLKVGWQQTYPRYASPHVTRTTYGSGAGPRAYSFDITSGETKDSVDFGNFELGAVSGIAFNDKFSDGVYNPADDIGLSGLWIKISGPHTDSVQTDPLGAFTLQGLPKGNYTLSEVLPTGWSLTCPLSLTYAISIDSSGTVITDRNFGNFKLGIISGYKFFDANENGVWNTDDPAEIALMSWIVRLSGSRFDTAYTDVAGKYTFANLPKGTYTITEDLGIGWFQTYPPSHTYHVTIDTSGTVDSSETFGNFRRGIISGTKFNDVNGNRSLNQGEPGIGGWKIRLTYVDSAKTDSVLTGSDGFYAFVGLYPGAYVVREDSQSGWVRTTANPDTIHLPPVGTVSIDFGNFRLVTIGGQKFLDLNGDGIKDAGEPPVSGQMIYLDRGNDGMVDDSMLTTSGGNYQFANVGPGIHRIFEVVPAGYTATVPPGGSRLDTTQSGVDLLNDYFGNFQNVTIGGQKFRDFNGNGIKDGADSTMSGWTIVLSKPGSSQAPESTVTDANGNYLFSNVSPGVYRVSELQQSGWFETSPAPDTGSYTINVNSSGTPITGKDFGNLLYGTISGRKFQDVNGDGIEQPEEPGLSDWHIILQDSITNNIVSIATTNTAGNYVFTHLAGGHYRITEEGQPGWIQTLPPANSPEYFVTLNGGENVGGKNFGNFSLGIVTGVKFEDKNANLKLDSNETKIAGWHVYLERDGGVIDSSITDQSGRYKFIAVSPGIYTVREESRTGWVWLAPNTSGAFLDTMTVGGYHQDRDFGNFKMGSISGRKFRDVNGNGHDDGDPGEPNWWIRITGPGRNDSVQTNSTGHYSFTGLGPGTYRISEGSRVGWQQTYPPDTQYTITLPSDKDTSGFDFGNFERTSIGGVVYFDRNHNRARDGADMDLEGWRVYLVGLSHPSAIESTQTNSSGTYKFLDLDADSFLVFEESRHGWTWLNPDSGRFRLYAPSGAHLDGINFGVFTDTNSYRTFSQEDYVQKSVTRARLRKGDPPNSGNARDAILKQMGNGFIIGTQLQDSMKASYGWARYTSNPVQFAWYYWINRRLPQTGSPTGFKDFKGRRWYGEKLGIYKKDHQEHLLGEQLILKFNLKASELGITPENLKRVIYDDPEFPNSPYNGKTIGAIFDTANRALTFYNRYDLVQLDTCLSRINRAFRDTVIDWADIKQPPPSLKFWGFRSVESVPYLRPNPDASVIPAVPNVDETDIELPRQYALYQNYPNPFNPSTTIEFELPEQAYVTLKIYDMLGQEVTTLFDRQPMDEGIQEVAFDASGLASGVYLCRLVAEGIGGEYEQPGGTFIGVRKMLLLK